MQKITVCSPAKINLTFEILGSLSNGYHEVLTLLQSISLQDTLQFEIEASSESKIVLVTNRQYSDFPLDDSNLISRAIKLYLNHIKYQNPLKITVAIEKKIPIGAGLAGGSGNAAAALLALNTYFGAPLAPTQLIELSAQLGADVPFSLQGGTCIGAGVGDKLTTVASPSLLHLLLLKPSNLSLSTAAVYQAFDHYKNNNSHSWTKPNTQLASHDLLNGSIELAAKSFGNMFEPMIFSQYPQLMNLSNKLLELGAICAHLSGSGPAIYAVTKDQSSTTKIASQLKELEISKNINCFTAQSLNHGVTLVS